MSLKTLKSLGDIGNLHDLRTAGTVRKSGKPQLPTTAILGLYMRRNERDRLVKEVARLKKRRLQIDRRLNEIEKEMTLLYEQATKMAAKIKGGEDAGSDDRETRKARHTSRGKRMVLTY
jgi:hypothetical protein